MGLCCGVGAGIGDLVALPVCEGSFSWAAGLEGGYGAEWGLLSERDRERDLEYGLDYELL